MKCHAAFLESVSILFVPELTGTDCVGNQSVLPHNSLRFCSGCRRAGVRCCLHHDRTLVFNLPACLSPFKGSTPSSLPPPPTLILNEGQQWHASNTETEWGRRGWKGEVLHNRQFKYFSQTECKHGISWVWQSVLMCVSVFALTIEPMCVFNDSFLWKSKEILIGLPCCVIGHDLSKCF